MHTGTLIIGGGLTGLSLAASLAGQGQPFLLVEARDRLGGRMLTQPQGSGAFDLGPAWFWPGQPRIARVVAQYGLARFEQYADGALVFENEQGQVQQMPGFAPMAGSLRIDGGMGALIGALAAELPKGSVLTSTVIRGLERVGAGICAATDDGRTITADRAVLAMPPRLAAGLDFAPVLPDQLQAAWQAIPTWMAGQAKALAVYERPFWREAGLSGSAMSRRGPMVEMHDASPAQGGPYGIFGFIGVPPAARADETVLRDHLIAQLIRLYGPQAADPVVLHLKDWAFDPFTATEQDHRPLAQHPQYGLPPALRQVWEGRVLLSGSEVAPQFGGFIEGALEAAENTLAELQQSKVAIS